MKNPEKSTLLLLTLLALSAMLMVVAHAQVAPAEWTIAGQSLANLRSQPTEDVISVSNANTLATKWVFQTGADVSSTPIVTANAVYATDWSGNIMAIDRDTGSRIWSRKISQYDGIANAVSRVSPAVFNDSLILGELIPTKHSGIHVIAIDQKAGNKLWMTEVDSHPAAIITGSPVVAGTVVYVGVSSIEEGLADQPGYACCTFRGSVVALDATTGKILWKTFDVPDNDGQPGGYSGGAIWSPPAIDLTRGLLYVDTGNNYSVPASVENCQKTAVAEHNPDAQCTASDDYFDSAIALDLHTGAIRWARKLSAYDVFTLACTMPRTDVTCPDPTGPDFDFGSGPNLLTNIVGFGQKSGMYWALNPDNGDIVWSTNVGPGGSLGGIQWGTASDGSRIYAAITNAQHVSRKLVSSNQIVNWGFWSALDASTGKILWQTPDPTAGTLDMGALSVANGVLYAGSFDKAGHMYALNGATGKVLWGFSSGGSVIDGPAIANGVVYWGSGYKRISPGTGNNKLYAFTVK